MLVMDEMDGRIAVTGDTMAAKDVLKLLPGRKWEPSARAWTFPRTVSSYKLLVSAFPSIQVKPTVVDLAEKSDMLSKASAAKVANSFIPYPSRTRPWLHQARAHYFAKYRLLSQGGAMLALDMGTGKSKVAIDLVNDLDVDRVLITCPTTVMDVWPDEFERHSENHYPVYVCSRKHTVERRAAEADAFLCSGLDTRKVIVINHEALWMKPFAEFVIDSEFDMLIVDESHRAKLASGKLSRFLGRLANKIPYRLALTGTPTPHGLDDMYAQARFIDPSVWGTNHQVYKSQYLVTGGFGGYQTLGYKNVEDWNEKFHGLAIQVRADDVLDLPERTHVTRYCDLSGEEMAAYNEMREHMITEVKGGLITAGNALVKLLRLSQIVEGVVKDEFGCDVEVGDSKALLLYDVLANEIPKDEPVVVFCRFKCDLKNIAIQAEEAGRWCYELSGDRNELAMWKGSAEEARETGVGAVLAVQIQAGGVGISMVQAKYCIYMSKDFSLGNYEQSLARVHRPGQKRHVTYIHLVAKGTIDETINKALAQRKDTVEACLAEMGG